MLACALFAVILLAARFWQLDADPDTSINWSADFLTDEGWYAGNAVNKALTGRWETGPNQYNQMALMPVVSLLEYMSFRAAGISLWTARLPLLVLNLLGVLLFLVLLRRNAPHDGLRLVVMALFWVAVNHYHFVFSRLALLDLPMTAFGLGALLFFLEAQRAGSRRGAAGWCLLAGLALAATLLTKTTGILFAGILVGAALIAPLANRFLDQPIKIGRIAFILVIAAFILVTAQALLRYWFAASFDVTYTWTIGEQLVIRLANYGVLFGQNWFFQRNSIAIILLFVALVVIVVRLVRERRLALLDLVMFGWLIAGLLLIGTFEYQPPRYMLPLIFPLAWFAAQGCLFLADLPPRWFSRWGSRLPWAAPALAAGLVIASNSWHIVTLARYLAAPRHTMQDFGRDMRAALDAAAPGQAHAVSGPLAGLAGLLGANRERIFYSLPEAAGWHGAVFDLRREKEGQRDAPADYTLLSEFRPLSGPHYLPDTVLRLYRVNRTVGE